MTEITVNIVGAGRVGETFLRLLRDLDGFHVQDVLNARVTSARKAVSAAGTGRAVGSFGELRPARLWVLAVPDTQIAAAADKISRHCPGPDPAAPPPVAFHCSGFLPAAEMAQLRDIGWRLASVHPVLSFADPAVAARQFTGTFCGIEGDDAALDQIRPMLEGMGAIPFDISSEAKSLYHAAAVFSNNFTTVLQAIAREAWAEAGVPDTIAAQLNHNLLQATLDNIAAKGPQDALTGPAARGDQAVIDQQGQDVARWHPEAGRIYRDMSTLAKNLKKCGKTAS